MFPLPISHALFGSPFLPLRLPSPTAHLTRTRLYLHLIRLNHVYTTFTTRTGTCCRTFTRTLPAHHTSPAPSPPCRYVLITHRTPHAFCIHTLDRTPAVLLVCVPGLDFMPTHHVPRMDSVSFGCRSCWDHRLSSHTVCLLHTLRFHTVCGLPLTLYSVTVRPPALRTALWTDRYWFDLPHLHCTAFYRAVPSFAGTVSHVSCAVVLDYRFAVLHTTTAPVPLRSTVYVPHTRTFTFVTVAYIITTVPAHITPFTHLIYTVPVFLRCNSRYVYYVATDLISHSIPVGILIVRVVDSILF